MAYKNNIEFTVNKSDLKLDFSIVDKQIDNDAKVYSREVVRGISFIDNKLLVVYPGDEEIYGTPGGGIEDNEDLETALRRELHEEVGAVDIEVIEYLGKMDIKRFNFGGEGIYNAIHHYYLVDIKKFGKQKLVEYEKEMNLKYKYIEIDVLIALNEKALQERNIKILDFYSSQTILFKELKNVMKL